MFRCYVGGYDCNAETIRENHWEPAAVFETFEEAFNYCDREACYDDTGWIEYDGVIHQYFDWDL